MQNRETLKRHAALVDRMAEARGLDLEEEILRGRMTLSDLDDAVLRCTGCAEPGNCEHWLAGRDRTAPAEDTPDYCRNRDLFAGLTGG